MLDEGNDLPAVEAGEGAGLCDGYLFAGEAGGDGSNLRYFHSIHIAN